MQLKWIPPRWAGPGRAFAPALAAPAEAAPPAGFLPRWVFSLLAGIALLDLAWLALSPLSLDWASARGPITGILFASSLLMLCRMLAPPRRLVLLAQGLCFLMVAWPTLRLFNHLAMSTAFPLADPLLSGWDRALGFDWLGYLRLLDGSPALLAAMDWAYTGLDYYSCFTFLALVLFGCERRAREFLLLFLLTAVGATGIGLFFPALAATAFYKPDPALFAHLTGTEGTYHLDLLHALRTDPSHVLTFRFMPGLTTFPSFHTAMGLICVWCARGTLLFVPLTLLNLLMIASTPVFGSHYLVDLIGGVAVTAGAVLLLRRLQTPELKEGKSAETHHF